MGRFWSALKVPWSRNPGETLSSFSESTSDKSTRGFTTAHIEFTDTYLFIRKSIYIQLNDVVREYIYIYIYICVSCPFDVVA